VHTRAPCRSQPTHSPAATDPYPLSTGQVPANIDPATLELLPTNNAIVSVDAADFSELIQLERIYFENNGLRYVGYGALHG
jgi:hypothetical protein